MDVKVGVINPYALGELVLNRNINWNTVPEPQQKLAEILNIPEEAIFDIKNPILNPRIEVKDSGEVKVLAEEEAQKRLTNFLGKRAPRIDPALPGRVRISSAVDSMLPEIFLLSAVRGAGTNTPWTPTDKDWVDKGDYFEDVAEVNDPIQGVLGDCYFIAALSSVAWARPYVIINMIRPSGWGAEDNPIHLTKFYKDGTGAGETVEVTENIPVTKTTHTWVYARSLDATEIWPAVMEKAYAKWRTGNTTDFPNYPSIAGGDPVMACAQLIRGARTYKGNAGTSADALWDFVRGNSLSRRTVNPMVAWTYSKQPSGTNYSAARVVANHAYSVLGWDYYNGIKYIVLRNPWGTHHATLDTRAGMWQAHQVSYWANIPLNANGVFSMKASTFKSYFAGIGVAV